MNASQEEDSGGPDLVPPVAIGATLCFLTTLGLLANVTAAAVIFKRGLLSYDRPQIYKPILSLLISDSIVLATHGFYLAPGIVLQRRLFNGTLHRAVGFVTMWAWDQSCLSLSLVALNRFRSILIQLSFKDVSVP